MKTINFLIILSIFAISIFSFGQESIDKPISKMNVSDFYIYSGVIYERYSYSSNSSIDFKALAPQSKLLNKFSEFSESGLSLGTSNTALSVMVGIRFSDKQKNFYKANPKLRIGLSYSSGSNIFASSTFDTRKPFDTLTSSQTGNKYFVDSVFYDNRSLFYNSDQLRINGSLIFSTNPEARWSMYTGIGLTFGISLEASTRVRHSISGGTETISPTGETNYSRDLTEIYSETEVFSNKTNFGLSAYIPLGIDFRLGERREFWKSTHLFYEIQPTLNYNAIPEIRTNAKVNIQHGLGFRVDFN